jgi:putative transposase
MEKFKSKYRIESTRLRHWNYGTPGFYFLTICTRGREHFFGEIQNDEMLLNEIGKIADDCWSQIPNHFKNAELGDFMIMPNHVHGIIIVSGIATDVMNNAETGHAVEAGLALSLHDHETTVDQQPINNQPPTHFRFRNQGKNTVSAMIGSFRSSVTRLARPIKKNFGWQSRFHDHIIRSRMIMPGYQIISVTIPLIGKTIDSIKYKLCWNRRSRENCLRQGSHEFCRDRACPVSTAATNHENTRKTQKDNCSLFHVYHFQLLQKFFSMPFQKKFLLLLSFLLCISLFAPTNKQ